MEFLNRCAVRANEGGSSSFTLTNAIPGFYTPPLCLNPSVVDGATYRYFAVSDDGTQHEEGDGVWNASESELTRETIRNSSNDGAAVFFSAAPIVYMGGATANDMVGGTSDVLNVTGDSGSESFTIPSLLGIRRVNLTAPSAALYTLDIDISGYPLPGQNIEFCLSEDSDAGAQVVFASGDTYVGDAVVGITLSSSDGRNVVMQRMEDFVWQVISQQCKIAVDSFDGFITLQGVSLSRVVSMTATPNDGDQITPYFPQVVLASNGGGAINTSFDTGNIYSPSFIRFEQSDPGDSFIVNPAQFRNLDGSTPSAITFDANGECMSIFVYDGNSYVIISASPGVVTP